MTDYSHARLTPTHDGDVCCDPEPTAGQYLQHHKREPRYAASNIARLLGEGPMTAFALRGATAHSEHTIASALVWLAASQTITRRPDGRWELRGTTLNTDDSYEYRLGAFIYLSPN